jgi:hypothetical protein
MKTILEILLDMYVDEPCRICGELLTLEDIKNGAVYAGYSSDNIGRSAHKKCWEKNIPFENWKIK